MPVRVFISYAHEDRAWCERLLAHLGGLRYSGQLAVFDDQQIKPGERWDDRIRGELDGAAVVVPLISPSFIGSRYCSLDELLAALQANKRLVPVIVDHVDLEALPVAAIQCLPKDERQNLMPLVDWANPNRALAAIAAVIRKTTAELGVDAGSIRQQPLAALERCKVTAPGCADRADHGITTVAAVHQAATSPLKASRWWLWVLLVVGAILVSSYAYWAFRSPSEPMPTGQKATPDATTMPTPPANGVANPALGPQQPSAPEPAPGEQRIRLMELILRMVALVGAAAHVFFFYKEAIKWDVRFVERAAPSWIERVEGRKKAESYVAWSKDLAINMGAYNLILAVGLAWVAIAGADVAGSLGIFLAVWLLGAAAAAAYTKVKLAFYAQGAIGVILLIAALVARP